MQNRVCRGAHLSFPPGPYRPCGQNMGVETSASPTDPVSRVPVDAQLSALLGPLRRAVLRRTRAAEDLPDLPEAQIELLRLLVATGGVAPSRAAAELNVAQSTISTLLRTMTADDLVERLPTPGTGVGRCSSRRRGRASCWIGTTARARRCCAKRWPGSPPPIAGRWNRRSPHCGGCSRSSAVSRGHGDGVAARRFRRKARSMRPPHPHGCGRGFAMAESRFEL